PDPTAVRHDKEDDGRRGRGRDRDRGRQRGRGGNRRRRRDDEPETPAEPLSKPEPPAMQVRMPEEKPPVMESAHRVTSHPETSPFGAGILEPEALPNPSALRSHSGEIGPIGEPAAVFEDKSPGDAEPVEENGVAPEVIHETVALSSNSDAELLEADIVQDDF